jgi:serine/threonine protein kinase
MKACRKCGNPIEDFDGAEVCATCAIVNVLEGAWDYLQAPPALPLHRTGPLIDRLLVREDFFERYQILESLDQGGQGRVWKVWDCGFRRVLAMKALNEEMMSSEAACYRFLAEAQITSQLQHPGILPVYDLGLDLEGKPFYTTELSNGVTLAGKAGALKGKGWTKGNLNAALELVARVCEIMAHAHGKGVIHRDLKPSNVLVGEHGEVRIIDWGSARVLKHRAGTLQEAFVEFNRADILTDRDIQLGKRSGLATSFSGYPSTIFFTPPEFVDGTCQEAGPETDVYAVGVMLYEVLTGQLPFIGKEERIPVSELRRRILAETPIPINRIDLRLSKDLAAITTRAMAKEKDARYRSMQGIADDLRAAVQLRMVKARQPSRLLRAKRFVQRNLVPTILLGFITLLLSAGFFTVKGLQAKRNADRQVRALANAEVDRRRGKWREVLSDLNGAVAAGFNDVLAIGLQRAEAWAALDDYTNTGIELRKLSNQKAGTNGIVLLRLGEYELFDSPTMNEGKQLVLSALKTGLGPDDEAFARGLLASNSSNALVYFRQALTLNPYHHDAHLNTIGIEYLLGLHEELAGEILVFKQFYPDDPTSTYLQAFEAAALGRTNESDRILNSLKQSAQEAPVRRARWECKQIASLANALNLDHYLACAPTERQGFIGALLPVTTTDAFSKSSTNLEPMRFPHLPFIEEGLAEAYTGVKMLSLGRLGQPMLACKRIQAAHLLHAESTPALLGGIMLGGIPARSAAERLKLLSARADLFQLAADSRSMFPQAPRLARYLAAECNFQITTNNVAESPEARQLCVKDIRAALESGTCSVTELSNYYDIASKLMNLEVADGVLSRWEAQEPASVNVVHRRIELALAAGSFGEAKRRLDEVLLSNPNDPWALSVQGELRQKIKEIAHEGN